MTDDLIAAAMRERLEFTPTEGYNLCGLDRVEPLGERLHLIKGGFKTRAEAEVAQKSRPADEESVIYGPEDRFVLAKGKAHKMKVAVYSENGESIWERGGNGEQPSGLASAAYVADGTQAQIVTALGEAVAQAASELGCFQNANAVPDLSAATAQV